MGAMSKEMAAAVLSGENYIPIYIKGKLVGCYSSVFNEGDANIIRLPKLTDTYRTELLSALGLTLEHAGLLDKDDKGMYKQQYPMGTSLTDHFQHAKWTNPESELVKKMQRKTGQAQTAVVELHSRNTDIFSDAYSDCVMISRFGNINKAGIKFLLEAGVKNPVLEVAAKELGIEVNRSHVAKLGG